MKECKYCRSKYNDGLTACPNCGGTKIMTAQELTEEASQLRKEIESREKAAFVPGVQKKRIIGVLAAMLTVIVCVIGVVSFLSNRPLSNGMSKKESEAVLANGIAYYEAGNYEDAIECFSQLPSDSDQYEEAQSLLTKSIDTYRSSITAQVNTYVQEEKYEQAVNLCEKSLALLPDDAKLKEVYSNARTAYRDDYAERATEFLENKEYSAALDLIEVAESIFPNDAKLQTIFVSAQTAYKADYLERVNAYLEKEEYDSAIELIEVAQGVFPNDAELKNAFNNTFRKSILVKASSHVENKQYNTAIELIEKAYDILPNDAKLKEAHSSARAAYKADILSKAAAYMEAKDYTSVMSLIDVSKSDFPNDTDLQTAYNDAFRSDILVKVEEYVAGGKLEDALTLLNNAQKTLPNDVELKDTYASTYTIYKQKVCAEAIASADAYADEEDFANAVLVLLAAQAKIGTDEALSAKYATYENALVDTTISLADSIYIPYNAASIVEAQSVISKALLVLPKNTKLLNERTKYNNCKPVLWTDLSMDLTSGFDDDRYGSRLSDYGEHKDESRISYTISLAPQELKTWSNWDIDTRSAIKTDYQYSRLTGVLFQDEKYKNANIKTIIDIYGFTTNETYVHDNNLLATYYISGGMESVVIDVDISQYKVILIRYFRDDTDDDMYYAYLADLYVWK